MSTPDAEELCAGLARMLAEEGALTDPAWRAAFEAVPRHVFVPGFYLRSAQDAGGLPVWKPVTEKTDPERWLTSAYADQTLITQLDGEEEDWQNPRVRNGGVFTSSSTLPSLVARMWHDADIADGHTVLEIGTGTGYSTALACHRLGSDHVTSIEVDGPRLRQAHRALEQCGYAPRLAEADGTCGYWPSAPYDRIVLACSMRRLPAPLVSQSTVGGKLLVPLSGWLHASARALLTTTGQGRAEGPLLPGTISFMLARVHAPPRFGNPNHWAALAVHAPARPTAHAPERIAGASVDTFHTAFLAQCAVPHAQEITMGRTVHLIDAVSGSVALLEPDNGGGWVVRQAGPVALWDRVEEVLEAYDAAGRPPPEEFTLTVTPQIQVLEHPGMPALCLPGPP